jgi:hypothetical protein
VIWLVWAALLSAPAVVLDDMLGLDLALGPEWRRIDDPLPAEGGTILLRMERGAETVVVARRRGNTDAAYAKEKPARTAYFDGVEKGVRDETPGYRRLSVTERGLGRSGAKNIPALDLWFRGREGIRGLRFVFFHGYMVVLALSAPVSRPSRDHHRIVESFVPVVTRTAP